MTTASQRVSLLVKKWESATHISQVVVVAIVLLSTYYLHQLLIEHYASEVTYAQVLGSNVVGGGSGEVNSEETLYLNSSFNKATNRSALLDQALFVEQIAEKIVPVIDVPNPIAEPVVVKKTVIPISTLLKKSIRLSAIESDGAFINGNYFLWGETLNDFPIITEDDVFKVKLIKRQGQEVILSVAGEWVALGISK